MVLLHCHLLRVKVTVAESPIALLKGCIYSCDLKRSSQTIKPKSYTAAVGDSFINMQELGVSSVYCLLSSL